MLNKEDIVSIIEDSVFLHTLDGLEMGVGFEVEYKTRPLVRIDVAYIQDVLTQLILNAMGNSENGSNVKIVITENIKDVRISVSCGNTKPEDFVEMAGQWSLDSHWRLGQNLQRKFETSLPILRKVVERHGGMLWITKIGQANPTNYTLELPKAELMPISRVG